MKYQVKRSSGAPASKKREENYTAECVPPSARIPTQTRAWCGSATRRAEGRTHRRPDRSDSQQTGNTGGGTAALNIIPETIRFPCNTNGIPKSPVGHLLLLLLGILLLLFFNYRKNTRTLIFFSPSFFYKFKWYHCITDCCQWKLSSSSIRFAFPFGHCIFTPPTTYPGQESSLP